MNISALDLNLLLVFEALLDERNVSRAAKRLALSQPATSNALARLRAVIGDPLFTRNQRGMRPTPRAEQLAAGVRLGLAQIRSALGGAAKFDPATSTRAFRVAMADSAEWLLLPPLSQQLTGLNAHNGQVRPVRWNSAPAVRLQIRRLDGLFLIPEADLRAGACDLAIGYFPDSRTLSDGLQSEDLFEEEQQVVFRRGHPALRRPLTLESFAALEHASVIYRSEPWGLIDTELAARGLRRNLRLAAPHFHTVLASVAASDLAAVAPERIAERGKRLFGLVLRPSPLRIPRFVTRMVWRRADQDDDAHCWLRGMVRAAAVQ